MNYELLISVSVSIITIIGSIFAIRLGLRQIRQEDSQKMVKIALIDSHLSEQQKSICHAHDKIRELEAKNNNTNIIIAELKISMQENTRVLRDVENALKLLSTIEERLNGHIELSRP